MRCYYDLHIHTALSPCGDNDMTPGNIVGMAQLCGLSIIAVTDHNSCGNCGAVIQAGQALGLPVIPGMELCAIRGMVQQRKNRMIIRFIIFYFSCLTYLLQVTKNIIFTNYS